MVKGKPHEQAAPIFDKIVFKKVELKFYIYIDSHSLDLEPFDY